MYFIIEVRIIFLNFFHTIFVLNRKDDVMTKLSKHLKRIRRRHEAVQRLKDRPKFEVGDKVRITKRIHKKDYDMYQRPYLDLIRDSYQNKTVHTVSSIDELGYIYLENCRFAFLEEDLRKVDREI